MNRIVGLVVGLLPVTAFVACQGYDFLFQPDADRQITRLRFAVEQPSKADLLFVIDNSGTMREEQTALGSSVLQLINALATKDTSYRIGIVSTDVIGWDSDCLGFPLADPFDYGVGRGNCDPGKNVRLRGFRDGTTGRLIAAYDPEYMDVDLPANRLGFNALAPEEKDRLRCVLPSGATTGGTGSNCGEPTENFGARWVIDREEIRRDACRACKCNLNECSEGNNCFDTCAAPLAPDLVRAYFLSNIAGLGTSGQTWEAGLEAALLAVGIDATWPDDAVALNPPYNLLAPGGFNTFAVADAAGGQPVAQPWIRDEALLAIMFVTDEEDCSMSSGLKQSINTYEAGRSLPSGSVCYQEEARPEMLDVNRMARLLRERKLGQSSRVAVGLIGGVEKIGSPPRDASPSDCVSTRFVNATNDIPSSACGCLHSRGIVDCGCAPANGGGECAAEAGSNYGCTAGLPPLDTIADQWCQYSQSVFGGILAALAGPGYLCDGLAAQRYVPFARNFPRRTFESVCLARTDVTPPAFSGAMQDFALIATLACFDLQGVRPVGDNPDYIEVKRASREDALNGLAPQVLPVQPEDSDTPGWFYDADEQRICLTGLDRLVGDVYDVQILTNDSIDFTR